ncbi:MAG: class I SAM-dependent methyltransferase, partial [Pseudomonadota bacterium]|nr:class I SAM-dependent methyltransferase [Pseudomonadota bacterium]
RCQVADAYALDAIDGEFSAAFAHYWWSHMPKQLCQPFLESLHRRLRPGAVVSFTDNLPYEAGWVKRRVDEHGDIYEERSLRDGSCFETIKNFPSQAELAALLEGVADSMTYTEHQIGNTADGPSRLWTVTYRLRQ